MPDLAHWKRARDRLLVSIDIATSRAAIAHNRKRFDEQRQFKAEVHKLNNDLGVTLQRIAELEPPTDVDNTGPAPVG